MFTATLNDGSGGKAKEGPFILSCPYCMWSSLDVGIKFEKGSGLRGQLEEIANGGGKKPRLIRSESLQDDAYRKSSLGLSPMSPTSGKEGNWQAANATAATAANDEDEVHASTRLPEPALDATSRFQALKSFYRDQINESSTSDSPFSTSSLDMSYSSPSSLQRIMNLYTNKESALKQREQRVSVMREARSTSEGLQLSQPTGVFEYEDTTTTAQRVFQFPSVIGNPDAKSTTELRPMPTLMRTKRSKRCAACKHILTRPEIKISSARYRIKLTALSYIPFISIKPLPVPGGLLPPEPDGGDVVLAPGKPVQFIMTLRNPLFEDVNVSLGSPSVTPGKHGHRVTILCPQFKVGRNSDAWDDALSAVPKLTSQDAAGGVGGEQIAGKLYDQGRNWASVVIEIVPASISRREGEDLEEDEDVVEVPIRVRLEWTVSEDEDAGITERRKKDREKVKDDEGGEADDGRRELSYWMVLGMGRVDC
jgi:dynactin 4